MSIEQQILDALKEQTAAINRLVEMGAMLIEALAEDQDVELEPTHYMDGSPIEQA